MVKVIIKGTVRNIGPVIEKDTYCYKRLSVTRSGYIQEINRRISPDQTYEITVANGHMDLLHGINVGDQVETISFLNSTERTDGNVVWHALSLNLRRLTKLNQ